MYEVTCTCVYDKTKSSPIFFEDLYEAMDYVNDGDVKLYKDIDDRRRRRNGYVCSFSTEGLELGYTICKVDKVPKGACVYAYGEYVMEEMLNLEYDA